jgi:chromosome segregation ATPase
MSEVHETVAQHHTEIENIKGQLREHADAIDELRKADMQILERLGQAATHEDVLDLHTKIDSSINGLLKDALEAIPAKHANSLSKQAVIWTMIGALTAIFALFVALVPHGTH